MLQGSLVFWPRTFLCLGFTHFQAHAALRTHVFFHPMLRTIPPVIYRVSPAVCSLFLRPVSAPAWFLYPSNLFDKRHGTGFYAHQRLYPTSIAPALLVSARGCF